MATLPNTLERRSPSAFGWSAPRRVAAVSGVIALLWLAVAWALGIFG